MNERFQELNTCVCMCGREVSCFNNSPFYAAYRKREHWTFNDVISWFEYAYVKMDTVPIYPLTRTWYIHCCFRFVYTFVFMFRFFSRLILYGSFLHRAFARSPQFQSNTNFGEQQWLIQSIGKWSGIDGPPKCMCTSAYAKSNFGRHGKTTIELCFHCIITSLFLFADCGYYFGVCVCVFRVANIVCASGVLDGNEFT